LQTQQPKTWQQAHKKLYEYYNALPKKTYPDTLEEMRPLFHAVTHGCAAGLHQRVVTEVYYSRINRKEKFYNLHKLGAFSDDLAAITCFFNEVWQKPSTKLKDLWQLRLVGNAGFCLRALGRLREALAPMQASVEMALRQKDWIEAAKGASNLSELQLTLGDVAQAVESGARSSRYADQSEDMFQRMGNRTTHADALHQAGNTAAIALFREAEQLQQECQPAYPRLYSLPGFRYCDLLLAQGSTAEVLERAEEWLNDWNTRYTVKGLLDFALLQLTLGRAHLVGASPAGDSYEEDRLQGKLLQQAGEWLEQAVAGLRAAGDQTDLPRGLLARAALHRHTRDFACARQDLQEVFDIADGSGMRLHLTDYHLEMARLLVAEEKTLTPTPLPPSGRGAKTGESTSTSSSPSPASRERGPGDEGLQYHIEAAAKLIEETGYHRRDPELAALQGLAHDR
jgi:tetratricopeptide (TPR) repeat protein